MKINFKMKQKKNQKHDLFFLTNNIEHKFNEVQYAK